MALLALLPLSCSITSLQCPVSRSQVMFRFILSLRVAVLQVVVSGRLFATRCYQKFYTLMYTSLLERLCGILLYISAQPLPVTAVLFDKLSTCLRMYSCSFEDTAMSQLFNLYSVRKPLVHRAPLSH